MTTNLQHANCSVSSRSAIPYGKQRELSRLRRSGLLLYQSEPLCMVLGRLEVEVECGRLRMHGECAPHVDVGVRQDILHLLLLSYNPVWLQLGLEVSVPLLQIMTSLGGVKIHLRTYGIDSETHFLALIRIIFML